MGQTEDIWLPETAAAKALVLEQLQRLLRDPLFRASKRYTGLLRFTVQETLDGNADCLRERYLGVEVFHRPADYDTGSDPVVRLCAAEVRKRIAQYYQQPEHDSELRIQLNPGSYAPHFVPAETSGREQHQEQLESSSTASAVSDQPPERASRRLSLCIGLSIAVAFLAAVLALVHAVTASSRATDEFWAPIIAAPGDVTLCVGKPEDTGLQTRSDPLPPTVYDQLLHTSGVGMSGVITLMHIGAALEARHKSFRLLSATQTVFPQLREGPDIFIGALNNPWTMRLTEQLRFGFALSGNNAWIVDHKKPLAQNWLVHLGVPPSKFPTDYAIVARYHDPTLGKPVVLVAGISSEGLEAAGEMLSKPEMLKSLASQASSMRNPNGNVEVVIQTLVIDGRPGPPHILAIESW